MTTGDGEDYARHPRLAEPRTKEDWRCYIGYQSPTKPALPAGVDYQSMDPAAKRRLNRDRSRYHSALVLAWTPPVLHFEELILERLEANEFAPAGARPGLLIDGPPTRGQEHHDQDDCPQLRARVATGPEVIARLNVARVNVGGSSSLVVHCTMLHGVAGDYRFIEPAPYLREGQIREAAARRGPVPAIQ